MKKCPNCGKRISEDCCYCPECGFSVGGSNEKMYQTEELHGLTKVAYVFFKVGFILTCITIIGLAWAIPMWLHYKRCIFSGIKCSIGFKVCTIIFISEIAGVLMLIDTNH